MTSDASLITFRQSLSQNASPANKRLVELLDTWRANGGNFISLRRGLIRLLEEHIDAQNKWDELMSSEASLRALDIMAEEAIAEHRAGLTEPMETLWDEIERERQLKD